MLSKLFILVFFFNKFCCGSDEPPQPTEPLIDVIDGGMYTGQSLANLVRSVREILDSNVPADEFKVITSSNIPTLSEVVKLFEFVEEDITECKTL